MKRLRICYPVLTVILLFAALITGRREFFLLLFMFLFVAVYALILNLWTIFSFTFVQELSQPTGVKGGLARLKINIHNDKPFPFTLMRIEVETTVPSEKTALRFNLSPMDSISFDIPLYCAYRGEFAVGMAVIEVTDIFGLFKIRYDLRALPYYRQKILKIYPKVIALRFLPVGARDSKLTNGGAGRTGNGGDSFSTTRDYLAGDSFKQIHWTASARMRKLITKVCDPPSQTSALIVLDNAATALNAQNGLDDEALLQYADLACECACAIARFCSGKGRTVKLVFSGGAGFVSRRARPKHDFAAIYEQLAVLPFSAEDGLLEKARAEIKSSAVSAVYILTCRQDEELARFLTETAGMGCDVKYVLIRTANNAALSGSVLTTGASCSEISYGGDVAAVLESL